VAKAAAMFTFALRFLLVFGLNRCQNKESSTWNTVDISWNPSAVSAFTNTQLFHYFKALNNYSTFSNSVTYFRVSSDLGRLPAACLWSRSSDFPPFTPRPTVRRSASFVAALLLLSGDIQVNPGPRSTNRSADQLTVAAKFGIINCRSAGNKTALIHDLIADQELDALFLTDTWFNSDTPANILHGVAPQHYTALHVPRQFAPGGPSRGGGLAVVHRDTLSVRPHPLAAALCPSTCELQRVRVGLPPLCHTVFNVYRPQWKSSVADFVDELSDIIASVAADCSDTILLVGDLNAPGVDGGHVDDRLKSALDDLGLTMFVNSATRESALLDVLASSSIGVVSGVRIDEAGQLSDHRLVTANVTTRCSKPTITFSWRRLRDIDPRQFEAALRRSELFSQPAASADDFVSQLNQVVTQLLDHFAPLRHRHRRPPKPISKWLSPEAVAAKRERRRLERRWLKTGAEKDRVCFWRACWRANKLINSSRSEFYKRTLDDCTTQPLATRWKIVNELLHSHVTDRTRTDAENRTLCSTFADFFCFQNRFAQIVYCEQPCRSPNASFFLRPPQLALLITDFTPVTASEVLRILASTPHRSSSVDIIPPSVIKSCPCVFSELLAALANRSFAEGKFPTSFKHATVTPLLKKPSLDKNSPSSYRPISNLIFISKILERLCLARIQSHILSSPTSISFSQRTTAIIRQRPLSYILSVTFSVPPILANQHF
jgi:hypothetical protein